MDGNYRNILNCMDGNYMNYAWIECTKRVEKKTNSMINEWHKKFFL